MTLCLIGDRTQQALFALYSKGGGDVVWCFQITETRINSFTNDVILFLHRARAEFVKTPCRSSVIVNCVYFVLAYKGLTSPLQMFADYDVTCVFFCLQSMRVLLRSYIVS
jgi:hypothetical protein